MNSTLSDDLAYVRSVAEAGETAPLLSGRHTLWWGALLTLPLIAHWVIGSGYIPGVTLQWIGLVWMAFVIVGYVGNAVLIRSSVPRPGSSAAINKVSRTLWSTVGLALVSYSAVAVLTSMLRENVGYWLVDTILPVSFLVYAIAMAGAAAFSSETIRWLPIVGAIGFSAITTALIGLPILYLFAALGVVLVLILPAIQQIRNEPAPVTEG